MHIVNEDGYFDMKLIENMGDAIEACEECFNIIRILSGGDKGKINEACKKLGYPQIEYDLKEG